MRVAQENEQKQQALNNEYDNLYISKLKTHRSLWSNKTDEIQARDVYYKYIAFYRAFNDDLWDYRGNNTEEINKSKMEDDLKKSIVFYKESKKRRGEE